MSKRDSKLGTSFQATDIAAPSIRISFIRLLILLAHVHLRHLNQPFTTFCLLSFLQFVREFARLGLTRSVGGVLALAMMRELSPVVTAIIMAGRVGSSFAAELGTMQVPFLSHVYRVLCKTQREKWSGNSVGTVHNTCVL